MDPQQNRIDDLVTRLRENGMRLTPQRLAVLNTLIGNKEHLSADDIYDRVHADYPMTGLATVYKTISMLKEMGEITELTFGNEGARFDGSGEAPHPHFVCTLCNSIIDIEDDSLENLSANIAEKTGYHITNYRLDFFGICPKCQSG
jgi:Fur family peroxide stress response transcriptional regulator